MNTIESSSYACCTSMFTKVEPHSALNFPSLQPLSQEYHSFSIWILMQRSAKANSTKECCFPAGAAQATEGSLAQQKPAASHAWKHVIDNWKHPKVPFLTFYKALHMSCTRQLGKALGCSPSAGSVPVRVHDRLAHPHGLPRAGCLRPPAVHQRPPARALPAHRLGRAEPVAVLLRPGSRPLLLPGEL